MSAPRTRMHADEVEAADEAVRQMLSTQSPITEAARNLMMAVLTAMKPGIVEKEPVSPAPGDMGRGSWHPNG